MVFSELPNEIIEQILLELDPLTLARCRVTSKRLHELIDGSVPLQIVLEAGIDGLLVVGPHNRHLRYPFSSAKHLLDEIIYIREAIRKFMPRSVWRIPYETGPMEVSDGIICSVGAGDRPKTLYFWEMLAPMDEGHNPFETESNGKRYTHKIRDTDAGADDIVFSTGSDLVVLLERTAATDTGRIKYRLHFRAISTGGPHPEARLSYVEYTSPLSPEFLSETWFTQLYDDMVALLLVQDVQAVQGGVTVWNWKSGEVVVPCQAAIASMFLSQDQLLLVADPKADPPTFSNFEKMKTVVYSISKGRITHNIKLPALILRHPFLFTCPRQTLIQIPSAQVAGKFAPDPSLDIFALRFVSSHNSPCIAVISTQRLLDACNAAFVDQEEYPIDVDWNLWGPKGSRWFPPNSLSSVSERGIHGARMIAFTRPNAFDADDHIGDWVSNEEGDLNTPVILDFNPRPILQGATNCDFPLCRNTVIRDMWSWTILERGKEVVIESGLPFRAFVNKKEWPSLHVYLHSTALVSLMDESNDIHSFLQHPSMWNTGGTTE
ncbi:hypothetical protein FRC19_006913 [Serendipita sp. 401]|nr:hypothetical protein FRC19_006913 [Serendipita sp. 401]KAG9054185.1 hypothetical protein FS842_005863 [Serendipita sp. 407]